MTEQERQWEEDVNHQLDEDPTNWDLRLVYADRLNEWDRHDEALAQRFMAEKKKRPTFKAEKRRWFWVHAQDTPSEASYTSRLSFDYYRNLMLGKKIDAAPPHLEHREYPTRVEAELDLAHALDSHRQWLNKLYGA